MGAAPRPLTVDAPGLVLPGPSAVTASVSLGSPGESSLPCAPRAKFWGLCSHCRSQPWVPPPVWVLLPKLGRVPTAWHSARLYSWTCPHPGWGTLGTIGHFEEPHTRKPHSLSTCVLGCEWASRQQFDGLSIAGAPRIQELCRGVGVTVGSLGVSL